MQLLIHKSLLYNQLALFFFLINWNQQTKENFTFLLQGCSQISNFEFWLTQIITEIVPHKIWERCWLFQHDKDPSDITERGCYLPELVSSRKASVFIGPTFPGSS